jgi:hypothetical protein
MSPHVPNNPTSPRIPSVEEIFEESAMTTNSLALDATIFSCSRHPPPPWHRDMQMKKKSAEQGSGGKRRWKEHLDAGQLGVHLVRTINGHIQLQHTTREPRSGEQPSPLVPASITARFAAYHWVHVQVTQHQAVLQDQLASLRQTRCDGFKSTGVTTGGGGLGDGAQAGSPAAPGRRLGRRSA